MITFKQYLLEKTFDLDKDVELIYKKYFKNNLNKIRHGNYSLKDYSFDSSILKSKEAKEAHKLNPIMIRVAKDVRTNAYLPLTKGMQFYPIHKGALELLQGYFGNMEDTVNELPSNQRAGFKSEFDGERIKATIYHELSHWLDDTFHDMHITKRVRRGKEARHAEEQIYATKIIKQGRFDVAQTDYEMNAQIHNIKQAKKGALSKLWDVLSFEELVENMPNLFTIRQQLKNEPGEYESWKKRILKRMARENLLGQYMSVK